MFCHQLQRLNFKVTRNSFIIFYLCCVYIFIYFSFRESIDRQTRQKREVRWYVIISFMTKIYFHSLWYHFSFSLSPLSVCLSPWCLIQLSWYYDSEHQHRKIVVTNAVLIFYADFFFSWFMLCRYFLVQLIIIFTFLHLNVVGDPLAPSDLENDIYWLTLFMNIWNWNSLKTFS